VAGSVILLGGGEFTPALDDLDRSLLEECGCDDVVVVPTAAAYEVPARFVTAAEDHFSPLGAKVVGLRLLTRTDALDPGIADQLRQARLVYLTDGSSLHLESVLKRSPAWDALVAAADAGAIVVASGGAARAVCDPMVDPRGGAFAVGLGLLPGVAFVPAAESWSEDREHRTRSLLPAGVELHVLPPGEHVRIER
jgi:cyanophycinase